MSCFRAKPASADSVAQLAIVLPDHDDGDLIMENDDGHDHDHDDLIMENDDGHDHDDGDHGK